MCPLNNLTMPAANDQGITCYAATSHLLQYSRVTREWQNSKIILMQLLKCTTMHNGNVNYVTCWQVPDGPPLRRCCRKEMASKCGSSEPGHDPYEGAYVHAGFTPGSSHIHDVKISIVTVHANSNCLVHTCLRLLVCPPAERLSLTSVR